MAAQSPVKAPVSGPWVPIWFKLEGPYKDYAYLKICHNVYNFAIEFWVQNWNWLKETSGQRVLLIKIPEAIINIAVRIGPATSIPKKVLHVVANFFMPIYKLGSCAKPFLAFIEVRTRFDAMFKKPDEKIDYVVLDAKGNYLKATFPLTHREQLAGRFENIASWTLSLSECGNYIWKFYNASAEDRPPFATFMSWTGRAMSIKTLVVEGRFLFQTWWAGKHVQIDKATLSKQSLAGSILKIFLAAMCLAIELFQYFAANQYKPLWLGSALFWTRISSTFISPVANRYWPSMVTTPLYAAAAG